MPPRVTLLAFAVAVAAAAVSAAHAAAPPVRPLQTALIEPTAYGGLDDPAVETAYGRVVASGAKAVRVNLSWRSVSPAAPAPQFNAADPEDPGYDWSSFDRRLAPIVAHHLTAIAAVDNTPLWARHGSGDDPRQRNLRPDVATFAKFVSAAAKRYDGRTPGVPRIKIWQIWVEPNVEVYLGPQIERGQLVGVALYRSLLNAAADAIHRARNDNVVVAGGLSPFTKTAGYTPVVGPMRFMRTLLCMSSSATPRATCNTRVRFDVWAHHPYTNGGPTHRAYNHDDVSLGDLTRMKKLLDAAVRAGHVVSRGGPPRFWVTEFSWDTSPPDRYAVPVLLHARWVAEALYRMWSAGVTLVTWLQLRDEPYPGPDIQSGLYFRGSSGISADRAKPALRAFRFPFVAFRNRLHVTYWGRVPRSDSRPVRIEELVGRSWRLRAVVRSNRVGIFGGEFRSRTTRGGSVRARVPGDASQPFSLVVPPDRMIQPFGVG